MTNVSERGRWLREPLLHFLDIGTGIFLLYSLVRGGNETAPREIVISESRIEALAENFWRTWTRPPTPQELRGLVDDYVKEEVFYREAIAMGLDRDDTVIRRRLRNWKRRRTGCVFGRTRTCAWWRSLTTTEHEPGMATSPAFAPYERTHSYGQRHSSKF